MKILFLSPEKSLGQWMLKQGDEIITSDLPIETAIVENINPYLIISYNYRYIIKPEVFRIPKMGAVNLHVSYLPFNRGAHPNFWSHLEKTPTGVTIHKIDKGIDTGPVIVQKLVQFRGQQSLNDSYDILQEELKRLFKENYELLKSGEYQLYNQNPGYATSHKKTELPGLKDGWKTKIRDLRHPLDSPFSDLGVDLI